MTQAAEGELAGMSKTLRGFAAMEMASWLRDGPGTWRRRFR
jgi:hypothetical protein